MTWQQLTSRAEFAQALVDCADHDAFAVELLAAVKATLPPPFLDLPPATDRISEVLKKVAAAIHQGAGVIVAPRPRWGQPGRERPGLAAVRGGGCGAGSAQLILAGEASGGAAPREAQLAGIPVRRGSTVGGLTNSRRAI